MERLNLLKAGNVIPVIAGPTASGKTALAIELALKLNGEILSADSRQIYKYLSIGTAKPLPEQLMQVKHHFIDELEPAEDFNAGIFENRANGIIEKLLGQGKTPIVCGGSGLYIKALVQGIDVPVDINEPLREELRIRREKDGNNGLYAYLSEIDPEAAVTMLPQNWKRVMRAIEVKVLTGSSITHFWSPERRQTDRKFIIFGLLKERQELYNDINKRVLDMVTAGLKEETISCLERFGKGINALNTVGYKEMIFHLEGEITLERAIELIQRNTRHYAKRQMTWFNADTSIRWIPVSGNTDFTEIANNIAEELYERND